MAEVVAETQRLILRTWKPEDRAAYAKHLNTPAVTQHVGGLQSGEDMGAAFERIDGYQRDHGHTFWAVERKEDGAFLGFCGLKRANGYCSSVSGEVEIGWRLREDAWGKGYAKEAAVASLEHAFSRVGARRVVALTIEQNKPSRGLMLRLGMRRRKDLDYVDPEWPAEMNPVMVHELTRREWIKLK